MARLKRKVEAITKRERVMAFSYSHQVLTNTTSNLEPVLSTYVLFFFFSLKVKEVIILHEKRKGHFLFILLFSCPILNVIACSITGLILQN